MVGKNILFQVLALVLIPMVFCRPNPQVLYQSVHFLITLIFGGCPSFYFSTNYYDTPPPSPPHAKPCVLLPCSSFHPNTASQNFPSDLQIKHFTGHPDCEQTRFWKYRNSRICRRWTIFLQDHCCEIVSRVHRRILRRVFRGVFRGNLRRIFRRNLRRVLRKGAPETAAAAPLWQAKYRCRP